MSGAGTPALVMPPLPPDDNPQEEASEGLDVGWKPPLPPEEGVMPPLPPDGDGIAMGWAQMGWQQLGGGGWHTDTAARWGQVAWGQMPWGQTGLLHGYAYVPPQQQQQQQQQQIQAMQQMPMEQSRSSIEGQQQVPEGVLEGCSAPTEKSKAAREQSGLDLQEEHSSWCMRDALPSRAGASAALAMPMPAMMVQPSYSAPLPVALSTAMPPGGVIFLCDPRTEEECLARALFGLPASQSAAVAAIVPEATSLFLFKLPLLEASDVFGDRARVEAWGEATSLCRTG